MTNYIVSDQNELLQLDRVHAFLAAKAYWCLGIPYETVARAAANSLCFGVYRVLSDEAAAETSSAGVDGEPVSSHEQAPVQAPVQVGYARVVTDFSTFAWICDVYVEEADRGQGLSKRLLKAILVHPQLQGLRRICLATHDAHELYKTFGFILTKTPQNWLEIKIDNIYSQS